MVVMGTSGTVMLTGFSLALVYFVLKVLTRNKPKHSVHGKVVLITGASSGLGEACAHVFQQAGAKVILCARRRAELERVKGDLLHKHVEGEKHEPHIVCVDLADLDSIPKKAEEAIAIHGTVDILINNGGISYRGLAKDTKLDVDVQIMTVNYFGQVALTKAILPSMLERNSGHIVAVSSVQGRIAIPYRSPYAASKHALQAFYDCLRAEISHSNVQVCVVSPGYIQTKLSMNALTDNGSTYGVMDSATESGVTPQEVARNILNSIECGKKECLNAPFLHKMAIILRAVMPTFYFKLMKSRARKQRKDFEHK